MSSSTVLSILSLVISLFVVLRWLQSGDAPVVMLAVAVALQAVNSMIAHAKAEERWKLYVQGIIVDETGYTRSVR